MNGIKRSRNLWLFWLGGLLGALAFLCIFGFSPLNVCNDAFCRGGFVEKDIQQHYAGWLFLRQSPVSFPLCVAKNINTPDGISVAYRQLPTQADRFDGTLPTDNLYEALRIVTIAYGLSYTVEGRQVILKPSEK